MKGTFLSHTDAASLNHNNVLYFIWRNGEVTRTDIWENMSISRASVTQIIKQLLEEGLILESDRPCKGRIRQMLSLRINKDARHTYIFDWNTRTISLVDFAGSILMSLPLQFPRNCAPTIFSSIVLEGIDAIRAARPEGETPILGLGAALPGLINASDTTVLYSVELGWRNVNIRKLFEAQFGENVFLERSGNALALGEYAFGAAHGAEHLSLVLLGREGIGASTVIRGACQHGGNFMHGELGHIKLPSKVICSCGQTGCLEAIVQDRLMHNGNVVDDEIMEYLSIAISTMVNLVDQELVILAGSLVEEMTAGQREQMIRMIRMKITNESTRNINILFSQNADFMGVKGISAYVFTRCFNIS